MRISTLSLTLACLSLSASNSFAAPPASLTARLAAQNALFEEQYQSDLKTSPETATAFGDYRYNDQLDDYSLAGDARQNATNEAFLARLKAIDTNGFSEQDQLSHELLIRVLQQRLDNYSFKVHEMPVTQLGSPATEFADLPLAVPFDTVKQYEDYI